MNKHLTDADRFTIEQSIREQLSLSQIAERLSKSVSTISREIHKHARNSDKGAYGRVTNRCVHRRDCHIHSLCDRLDCNRSRCSTCPRCNSVCPDFIEEICSCLSSPPYVCNGCPDERLCTLRKRFYDHDAAQKAYRNLLSDARTGVNLTEDELRQLDGLFSPLILKGQSVHHILATHPDELALSEKTIYRYVAASLFSARNIDMPRVCRLKPRRVKASEHKVDPACRHGRSFEDFCDFLSTHPSLPVVQMDSVIGRVGGKVLLTFILTNCDLLLAFVRDKNNARSVIDVFNYLTVLLGLPLFSRLFPVILTDNGSEFSNPSALETAPDGSPRTRIFYCDPSKPYQKPCIENVHQLLRRVFPSGSSFDRLSQSDLDRVLSHINSYSREKLNDKPPCLLFSFLYGPAILSSLGLSSIQPEDICLKPFPLNS